MAIHVNAASQCEGSNFLNDALAKKIVAHPVSVPDFFATICAAVGVDYTANLHDGDRPVPITDRGMPIKELFS